MLNIAPPLLALLAATQSVSAWYLEKTYDSSNFFNEFNFETAPDPTHGDVKYVSKEVALSAGLVGTRNNAVYLGVDYKTMNPPDGRESVRLASWNTWSQGLFIADIAHMPAPACGIWPAFWTVGLNWPTTGEIDILEGVNLNPTNQVTLHTAPGCTVTTAGSAAGSTVVDPNCNSNNAYNGCSVTTNNPNNYGAGFNSIGGGVYAMRWTNDGIFVWFFPRNQIPSDIAQGNPNPSGWAKPIALFNGTGCNFNTAFGPQQIVFDTTFCGDWAGSVWSSGSCASKAATCNDYVNQNPSAFKNGYWLINSLKIYNA